MMKKGEGYQKLIVWQKAHLLALNVIKSSKVISREYWSIKEQLIRSITSIPANIAEGYGGHKGKGYKNFLVIARRSAVESDYWLLLLQDLGYLKTNGESFRAELSEISAILTAIINKL